VSRSAGQTGAGEAPATLSLAYAVSKTRRRRIVLAIERARGDLRGAAGEGAGHWKRSEDWR
jgi:hypothetical protein